MVLLAGAAADVSKRHEKPHRLFECNGVHMRKTRAGWHSLVLKLSVVDVGEAAHSKSRPHLRFAQGEMQGVHRPVGCRHGHLGYFHLGECLLHQRADNLPTMPVKTRVSRSRIALVANIWEIARVAKVFNWNYLQVLLDVYHMHSKS